MARTIATTDWRGCYDDSWKGIIVEDSFAHPAKFAFGLICRIVDVGLARGHWRPGDRVGDPFGGVALGGIVAAAKGLDWIGVELEPRFVELGQRNLDRNRHLFAGRDADLVAGDSRHFAAIVRDALDGSITSPPFQDAGVAIGDTADTPARRQEISDRSGPRDAAYGKAPGQIGNLPPGDLDAAITSPPYADSIDGDHGERETADDTVAKRKTPGGPLGRSQRHGGYGATDGQIGRLADGDTYWRAMARVYAQLAAAMKPGAVAAVVVKDYVKRGARVPLVDDTCRLLESVGLVPFERSRAWVVIERRHPDLFGGPDHVERVDRKSFFRRLAERNGSPPIDFEEVIWARRE